MNTDQEASLDREVRRYVYYHAMEEGLPPTVAETASALLQQDATIEASCGCCSTAMHLTVTNGSLEEAPGIAHFAIPAAHWWDDIVFN